MAASSRQTLILILMSVLAIGIPLALARTLLKASQLDAVATDRVNYLSHTATPKGLVGTEKVLDGLLDITQSTNEPVPRIFLADLPDVLPDLDQVRDRKALFVSTMVPLILRANELILSERATIARIADAVEAGDRLKNSEKAWLRIREKRYNIRPNGRRDAAHFDRMLYHIDVIPPSLAVTQAAIESGWGTSRFAQQGNAIFGEWLYGQGKGIVPSQRDSGKTHRIKAFDYLMDSVISYMTNLNRNASYADLRDQRAMLRRQGRAVTGRALIPSLHAYSERGDDYLNDLHTVMDYNRFHRFDQLQLIPPRQMI